MTFVKSSSIITFALQESNVNIISKAIRRNTQEAEDAETLRTLLPGVNPKSICGKVPQNVSHMDGLRLAFEDDTWLLVRPSGTEPVVRVYAEGFSVEERDELLDAGCALARGTYPL